MFLFKFTSGTARRIRKVNVLRLWWYNLMDVYYNTKNFLRNLPKFLKYAWNYRTWDISFAVDIFASNLEATAKALKSGWGGNSEKNYRRCMQAAMMLRRNFLEDDLYEDKSMMNNHRNNTPIIDDDCKFYIKRKYSEEYSKKIIAVVDKRVIEWKKQRRKDTLEFFNKYYNHFWD